MKPIYDPERHAAYCRHVRDSLPQYCGNTDLPAKLQDLADEFTDLDLSKADQIMRDRYSKFGPAPRQPSDMLRSLLVCVKYGVASITDWADQLKTIPSLAIISGFNPGDVPGVGTFYDFRDRLWLMDSSNFNDQVRPKREKPKKPKKKGEKAPPVEKKPVEDLINAFLAEPSTELEACGLLWEIFSSIFLERSEDEGLINLEELTLAGDGTPVRTGAHERRKRICSCREKGITDCKCDRFFSQPDCDWGYDSHRNCYFYGYHLYLLTDPSSKHDLPIFPFLNPASRHDSHSLIHTWFAAKALMPGFHANRVLLDSAHDALAIYNLMRDENTDAFIDLNKGHSTTQQEKGYTIGPDGIPVCALGHPMKPAGFDKAQHRLKYRCPKMVMRDGNIICQCDTPCSKAKYGRQVHVYPESNPRLFCNPPRGSKQWKIAYNARTGAERANKRIKLDYKLEDGRCRSTKAWYCRLFLIMMCIHHDAWGSSATPGNPAASTPQAA